MKTLYTGMVMEGEAVELVFIYGSLQRGHRHHELLATARFIGEARTGPGYHLVVYEDGYPALCASESGAVEGELFAVDEELLHRLDAFEECPSLYQRTRVCLSDGQSVFAYTIEAVVAVAWPRASGSKWTKGSVSEGEPEPF